MFPSDYSGILTGIVGLIAVIFFAVLASLWLDGEIAIVRPSTRLDQKRSVDSQQRQVANLKVRIERLTGRIENRRTLMQIAEEADALQAMVSKLMETGVGLRSQIVAQRVELEATQKSFDSYKTNYRKALWRNAAGTDLGSVSTVDGKSYEDATITKVNAIGIHIEHAAGTARLGAVQLPKELREKYMLDIVESGEALRAEAE